MNVVSGELLGGDIMVNKISDLERVFPEMAISIKKTLELEEIIDSEGGNYDGNIDVSEVVNRVANSVLFLSPRKLNLGQKILKTLIEQNSKFKDYKMPIEILEEDINYIYEHCDTLRIFGNENILSNIEYIKSPLLLSVIFAYADKNNIIKLKNKIMLSPDCPNWIKQKEIDRKKVS